ncbi:MAG: Gfo/Idh/MocA family oxidoreductase [Bacteroidales bacterium]|nr:Gfo/Idh/MocA family oxidoreductase [Bacteroidales bacterium]
MTELAVIGFGNRARKYVSCLEGRARVAAIVEPSGYCRSYAVRAYGIDAGHCFDSFDALLASGTKIDAAIIASPDKTHFDYARRCIELGWPVMLEKPIATDLEECRTLAELSDRKAVPVTVCYELRYHPYFLKLKELTENPELGKLLSVDWTVEVGLNRMMHSYVRGTWSKESESGPITLTKLCHDVDLLLWMIPGEPVSWRSDGERKIFRPENAPASAAARCIDCPIEKICRYSAVDLYLRKHEWISNFMPLPGESTDEMIRRILKESDYGRCVFHSDNDVNDTQTITLNYPDGLTAVVRMKCEQREGDRSARFVFEKGEIIAGADRITLRCGGSDAVGYDFSGLSDQPLHAGADKALVDDFIASLSGGNNVRSGIGEALKSHIICIHNHYK